MREQDLEAGLELYQGAQAKLMDAQHNLRMARRELINTVKETIGLEQAADMGIFSLNISSLRRFIRMSRR